MPIDTKDLKRYNISIIMLRNDSSKQKVHISCINQDLLQRGCRKLSLHRLDSYNGELRFENGTISQLYELDKEEVEVHLVGAKHFYPESIIGVDADFKHVNELFILLPDNPTGCAVAGIEGQMNNIIQGLPHWGALASNHKVVLDDLRDVMYNSVIKKGTGNKTVTTCNHSYVNIGFSTIHMACKHCGQDQ